MVHVLSLPFNEIILAYESDCVDVCLQLILNCDDELVSKDQIVGYRSLKRENLYEKACGLALLKDVCSSNENKLIDNKCCVSQ